MELHLSVGCSLVHVDSEVFKIVYTSAECLEYSVPDIITGYLIRAAQIVSVGHPDNTHQNRNHQPKTEFPGVEGGEQRVLTDNEPSVNEVEGEYGQGSTEEDPVDEVEEDEGRATDDFVTYTD